MQDRQGARQPGNSDYHLEKVKLKVDPNYILVNKRKAKSFVEDLCGKYLYKRTHKIIIIKKNNINYLLKLVIKIELKNKNLNENLG